MPLELILPGWTMLAVAGSLGQLLRALLGVKKAVDAGETIRISRLLSSVLYAMATGGILGYFTSSPELAFTTGFAATDFTESLISVLQNKATKRESKPKKPES